MKKISKMTIVLGALFLFILIIGFQGCGAYNKIISLDEVTQKAWADVESNLQRRYDLIPNLVSTVKGAADHEAGTLQAVIEARSQATTIKLTADDLSNPEVMANFQAAQDQLSSALSRLMVSVERYPDLKANQNFLALQDQLEGTENRINVARTRFNEAIGKFNSSIRRFPNNIINNIFLDLDKKSYFEVSEGAEVVPNVEF